jgi:3-oxoacyl-[acyl-carrier-protein] synthase-3
MYGSIRAIEYFLPENVLSTERLAEEFPDWMVAKIDARTGIHSRHISAAGECASDLAVAAAKKLFASGVCAPEQIDFVLLCTQSPDHFLPTTAGALDFNLGSSGYVYGLGLAEGLIQSGQASRVLLLTAETYSKFINRRDRSVRTIFGDGATATLVSGEQAEKPFLGPFVYGSNGSGAAHLIVPAGGLRRPRSAETAVETEDDQGNVRSQDNLCMNGMEIFNFTLSVAPSTVEKLLEKAGLALGDVGLFVFHQANRHILDHLRKRVGIPAEKFVIAMADSGNTGSSSIPIALKKATEEGRVTPGSVVMLVGFGPGYSWGGTLWRA